MFNIKLQSEYLDLDKYKNVYENIYYCKKDTDLYHNPYGPAIICKDGRKYYCIEHKYHRLDGPAIIWQNSKEEYFINDQLLTKEEFDKHPERLKFLGKEHLTCLI